MIMASTLWPSPTYSPTSVQFPGDIVILTQPYHLYTQQLTTSSTEIPALPPARPSWVKCCCTHTRVWEEEAGTAEVHVPWTSVVFHKRWELVFQTKFIRNSIIRRQWGVPSAHSPWIQAAHAAQASSQFVWKSWFCIELNPAPAAEGAHSSDTQHCAHITWAVVTRTPLAAKTDCLT